jgi:hypothetical protein
MVSPAVGEPEFCDVTRDHSGATCIAGDVQTCGAAGVRLVCFPPDPTSGCGYSCTGWGFDGCYD